MFKLQTIIACKKPTYNRIIFDDFAMFEIYRPLVYHSTMPRRLLIGDLHGAYRCLLDVLDACRFEFGKDHLYFTGDVADGYPEVFECIRFFRQLKNFHPVIGNHDIWLQNYLAYGISPANWLSQGGIHSVSSFKKSGLSKDGLADYAEYLSTWPYAVLEENFCLMHAGPSEATPYDVLGLLAKLKRKLYERTASEVSDYRKIPEISAVWSRDYYYSALDHVNGMKPLMKPFEPGIEFFVGHTPVLDGIPFICKKYRLINIDTGTGYGGRLTIIDMDSLEYWQSRRSEELYPGHSPR